MMDPGIFGLFRRSNGRDSIEKSLMETAVQTRHYLNRKGLTMEQEVAAELYLEATREFAKKLLSAYEQPIQKMIDSYHEMRSRKNGQSRLF